MTDAEVLQAIASHNIVLVPFKINGKVQWFAERRQSKDVPTSRGGHVIDLEGDVFVSPSIHEAVEHAIRNKSYRF